MGLSNRKDRRLYQAFIAETPNSWMHRDGRFFWPTIIYLRLSPKPVMGLELGTHPYI